MKDVAVYLDCYPEPARTVCIEHAVTLCAALGGLATGVALAIDMRIGDVGANDAMVAVAAINEAETGRQARLAASALARFRRAANAAGVYRDSRLLKARLDDVLPTVGRAMRLHDICVLPSAHAVDRELIEAALFGSGRPVLVFDPARAPPRRFDRVVVAWDGGRAAARAVADSLEFLVAAKQVTVLTVRPGAAGKALAADLARYLARNGVNAETATASGGDAADVISARAAEADLLIIGGYGHPRWREMVLGGVTRHIIAKPPTAVLMSH